MGPGPIDPVPTGTGTVHIHGSLVDTGTIHVYGNPVDVGNVCVHGSMQTGVQIP